MTFAAAPSACWWGTTPPAPTGWRPGCRAARRWRFGPGAHGLGLGDISTTAAGTTATLTLPDGSARTSSLRVPGVHNLRNATAAVAWWSRWAEIPRRRSRRSPSSSGVGRRFERLGEFGGIAIVDDYAHHPTELARHARRGAPGFSGPPAGGGLPAAPVLPHRAAPRSDGSGARRRRTWPS